jgi:leucyl-tRNA synthetase
LEREAVETTVVLLNPFVPHVTEELWQILDKTVPLSETAWPSFDPEAARDEEITIVIQVNGKLRGRIQAGVGEAEESIRERALREESVKRFTEGKTVRKVITVPGKLVNIVVS